MVPALEKSGVFPRGVTASGTAAGVVAADGVGVDDALLQEGFDGAHLRADRGGEGAGLLRDGRAAEHHDAGKQPHQQEADQAEPHQIGASGQAAQQMTERVEKHAEQDAGENQEQRRSRVPDQREQGGEGDDAAAAGGDGPRQRTRGRRGIGCGGRHSSPRLRAFSSEVVTGSREENASK
jgi:hypothetical protein